jgi:hypothetical protein
MPPISLPNTTVLVSPTALVLSMLHTGAPTRLPVTIARSRDDFMQRVLRRPPRVAVVERGWLSELDLRRLALRRAVASTPHMLLVLGRDQQPTALERMYFDAVVVSGRVFLRTAKHLQRLVGVRDPNAPATRAPQGTVAPRVTPVAPRASVRIPAPARVAQMAPVLAVREPAAPSAVIPHKDPSGPTPSAPPPLPPHLRLVA